MNVPNGILVLPFSTRKAAAAALAHPSKWHGVVTVTQGGVHRRVRERLLGRRRCGAYARCAAAETGQICFAE